MEEIKRNEVISKNEDMALNIHLEESDACTNCETEKGWIEYDDGYLCQSCYENVLESAEAVEDR